MESLHQSLPLLQGTCANGIYIIHSEPASWTQALQHYRHDFYHLPDYAALCARSERSRACAFEVRFENARFFMPMLIRHVPSVLRFDGEDVYTPYGYSGPLVEADSPQARVDVVYKGLACLRDVLHRLGMVSVFIRWHPLLTPMPERLPERIAVCLHGEIVVIDLTKPDDRRWHEMRRNHRQNIERLEKEGFRAVFDRSPAAIAAFAGMYRRTMQRVAASDYYYFSEEYILELMQMRGAGTHLCLVLRDGEAVCGGLFVASGDNLTCHLSATEAVCLPLSPAKLMFWAASCWGREAGLKTLNIGGGVGGHPDTPLFRFKQGFSPDRRFFDTVGIVCDPQRYAELCTSAGRLCDAEAVDGPANRYFPLYNFVQSTSVAAPEAA